MWKRAFVVLAVLALVTSGCSKKTDTATSQTYTIQVDGKDKNVVNAGFTAYFPNEATVRPGDTISFTHPVETGEPHTVTFGTLTSAFLVAADKLGPGASPEATAKLPENAKVPDIFPSGPGDANQSAAQKCFLAAEDPPGAAACTPAQQTPQPEFAGTETFYNSGWLAENDTFTMTIAKTAAPGPYRYMCLVHRAQMQGTITVAAAGATADKPDDVASKGQATLASSLASLKAAVDAVQAKPNFVQAGISTPDVQKVGGIATVFAPAELSVATGATVSWLVFGPHSLAFNAPEDAKLALVRAPDGVVHINIKSAVPAGGPGADPFSSPKTKDLGAYGGQGFRASGAVLSFPPDLTTFTMKFTTAGTYKYVCTIHPDMEGTITVA